MSSNLVDFNSIFICAFVTVLIVVLIIAFLVIKLMSSEKFHRSCSKLVLSVFKTNLNDKTETEEKTNMKEKQNHCPNCGASVKGKAVCPYCDSKL